MTIVETTSAVPCDARTNVIDDIWIDRVFRRNPPKRRILIVNPAYVVRGSATVLLYQDGVSKPVHTRYRRQWRVCKSESTVRTLLTIGWRIDRIRRMILIVQSPLCHLANPKLIGATIRPVSRRARESAEIQLNGERKLYDAGRSTTFLLFQRENSLTNARNAEVRAETDYNKALADLQRATATSFRANNVQVDSPVVIK